MVIVRENYGAPNKHQPQNKELTINRPKENKRSIKRLVEYKAEVSALFFDAALYRATVENFLVLAHRTLGKKRQLPLLCLSEFS